MMSLLAATLVGATAVASVFAVAPYVRRPRLAPRVLELCAPPPPAETPDATRHAELLAELNRPCSPPAGCRSHRGRHRRPLSH